MYHTTVHPITPNDSRKHCSASYPHDLQYQIPLILPYEADSYNKYFCYREFGIDDMDDNPLVRMHTIFVLMDFKNRKISQIVPELIIPFGATETPKVKRYKNVKKMIIV